MSTTGRHIISIIRDLWGILGCLLDIGYSFFIGVLALGLSLGILSGAFHFFFS